MKVGKKIAHVLGAEFRRRFNISFLGKRQGRQRRMGVRTKLVGAFAIILVLLLGFTTVNYLLIKDMTQQMDQVINEDFRKITAYKDLAYNMSERKSLAQTYITSGDTESKESFETLTKEANAIQEQILSFEESKNIDTMTNMMENWQSRVEDRAFESYERGETVAAETIMINEIAPVAEGVTRELQSLVEEENALVEENMTQLHLQSQNLAVISIASGVGVTVIGLVLSLFIAARMTRPIKEVTENAERLAQGELNVEKITMKSNDEIGQLAQSFNKMAENLRRILGSSKEAAEQVAATSEQLSASSEETSASTNEMATTIQEVSQTTEETMTSSKESLQAMKQLSADIEKVSHSFREVTLKSQETEEAAQNGDKEISRSSEQMRIINKEVQETAGIVKQLGERSTEIGAIIDAITSISDQTNLLALNAAIESARAGEHGKGFAVVADEVRKLAEESKRSADQIRGLIETIQSETDKAVEKMEHGQLEAKEGVVVIERAGQSFQTILDSVHDVSSQTQSVSHVAEQMSTNSAKVTAAVEEMNLRAEKTADHAQNVAAGAEEQLAAMEEVSSSSEELSRMSQGLQEEISSFKF